MKKSFNCFAITACFVLGTSLAYANPDSSHGNMHDQMFKTMDSNSDKMVTREEFNAFGAKKFQQMDMNGDDQLSPEEMKAAYKKMMNGESNKMSDRDMGSNKPHSKKDGANPISEAKAIDSSDNSCCWTPNSIANKSSNKMNSSQDKKMNDPRNRKVEDKDGDDD